MGFTHQLVEDRLAACGHNMPIRSIYTWDGTIHDDRETRVALHTRSSCVPAIIAATDSTKPRSEPAAAAL